MLLNLTSKLKCLFSISEYKEIKKIAECYCGYCGCKEAIHGKFYKETNFFNNFASKHKYCHLKNEHKKI